MKVAYLTGRYPSISHTFVLREVQALRRRGVEVLPFSIWRSEGDQLLSPEDREEAARTYSLLPARPHHWVRAHLAALAHGPGRYLAAARQAVRLSQPSPRGVVLGLLWFAEAMVLWHRWRAAAVEHVHVHLNGTAPAVALLAVGHGREVGSGPRTWSLTVHGPSEFYDVARERLGAKVRAADAVVCISDFARSQLMGLVRETEWPKLSVVHCGVDPSVFAPVERASGPEGDLELLCVGRLVPVKGQAVLVEAVRELRSRGVRAHVTFIGDGPRRESLEAVVTRLGLEDAVTFAGAVGQDAIGSYYRRADVFCMASFAEGVPVVLMEAMAMEIPCVATRIMGIPELVEDGVTGRLVRPGRADLLADAIAELAGDPDLRGRMGAAGRRKVLEEFTSDANAALLDELFSASGGARSTAPPAAGA